MLVRRVGHAGLRVSRLGLDTGRWGTQVSAHEAADMLGRFVTAGGTLVEVAENPARRVLGEILAASDGLRSRLVLALTGATDADGQADHGRAALLQNVETALTDLSVRHIDLWTLAGWDDLTPVAETTSALEQLVASDRIRYVGMSGLTAWQLSWWHAQQGTATAPVAVRADHHLLDRSIETDLVPAAAHLGVGLIVRSALAGGALTDPGLPGIPAALSRAADGLGLTPAQTAICWVRDRPQVASVLLDVATADQLEELLASEDVAVPAEILTALDDVSAPQV